MQLTDARVVIRPRSAWEALDLGVLVARRHQRTLMLGWACTSLPVYALLTLALWDYPSVVLFIFWWLKPAFERLALDVLSTALFGPAPSLREAMRQWPGLLKRQLPASLLWRRLSLSRSFSLPVQQLENLGGKARQQRLGVLRGDGNGAARWLTLAGMHLEIALWLGLSGLVYLLLPQQTASQIDWWQIIAAPQGQWLWLEHLSNALYAVVLVYWGPVYVSCGFSLYLNRRIALEAWDIELVLRNLRRRLGGLAAACLVVGLGLAGWSPQGMAQAPSDTPRLLQQPVNSQTAQRDIRAIVAQPPFSNPETITRWRFGQAEPVPPAPTRKAFGWLDGRLLAWLAKAFEVALWAALLGAVALLLWRYREWLQAFAGRRPAGRRSTASGLPPVLKPRPAALPADIAGRAEALWHGNPREALGLLYRGLLDHLREHRQLALRGADTESQVLEQVKALGDPALLDFTQRLTLHWQNLAYGHYPPPAQAREELCQGWRRLFPNGGDA